MAFGDPKGTQLVLTGASCGATNILTTGSATVVVGDLIVVCFAQQTALTASGVTDNLGNTYTAANAGTDAGVITGRFFYSRVTAAGALSSVTVAAVGSANDFAGAARAIEGPFDVTDLVGSTTPANTTADITTPFVCPLSGTLDANSGRAKLVVGWAVRDNNVAWASDSPNVEVAEANRANAGLTIGVQVVTGTTSTAPAFSGTNPAAIVLGTIAFNMGTQAHVGQAELLDGFGAFSATGLLNQRVSAELLDGFGALSVNALNTKPGEATLSGAGSLSVNATIPASTVSNTTRARLGTVGEFAIGQGMPLKLAIVTRAGEATFAGSGSLSVEARKVNNSAAIFAGLGSVSVQAAVISQTVANLVRARLGTVGEFAIGQGQPAKLAGAAAHQAEVRFAGSGSLSARALQAHVIAVTFAGAGSLSVEARQRQIAAATFSGAGSLSVNAVIQAVAHQGAATFAGSGSLSADAQHRKAAQATFAGSGSLSVLANQRQSAAATFAGSGSLSANVLQAHIAAATFSGSGSLSVNALKSKTAEVRLEGSGNLSARVTRQNHTAAVIYAGAGSMSINTTSRQQARATFNGAGNLSANISPANVKDGQATFAGAGSLSVSLRLNAAAFVFWAGAGTLSANVTRQGNAAAVTFTGAGTLSARATQAHSAVARFDGAGSLSAQASKVGTVEARLDGAGTVSSEVTQGQVIAVQFDGSGNALIQANTGSELSRTIAATFAGAGGMSVGTFMIRRRIATGQSLPRSLVSTRNNDATGTRDNTVDDHRTNTPTLRRTGT